MDSHYSIESESDYLDLLKKVEALIVQENLSENEEAQLSLMTDAIVAYEKVTYPI